MTEEPAAAVAPPFSAAALRAAPTARLAAAPEVTDLPPIARAGVDLARIVLWLIAGTAFLLLGLIALEEFSGSALNSQAVARLLNGLATTPPRPDDAMQVANYQKSVEAAKSLLTTMATAQQDTRDFLLKLCQLLLVGIFLPILTALLGYIFGTHQIGAATGRTDKG